MADLFEHFNESKSNAHTPFMQSLPTNEGGGGDSSEGNSTATAGVLSPSPNPSNPGTGNPSTNGPSKTPSQQQHNDKTATSALSKDSSQKDGLDFEQDLMPPYCPDYPTTHLGPNELFFGGEDRASGLCYKDREERVRQLRERQQNERQQKLQELKEQAAAAQRFREQQEAVRRQRLDEMRSKDSERRTQVEERKRLIQQAEQERRQAVLRKSAEREQRLELKRRQERSNAVFAFGSSTPRMLDPRENAQNYFGGRRATSTTNVNLSDTSSVARRSSECQETDLSRKRATSAHSLNRKPDDLRMSTSMYEVFNWDDASDSAPSKSPLQPHSCRQGTRLTKSRDSSVERRPRPRGLNSALPLPPPHPPRPRPGASTPDPVFLTASSPHSSNSSEKTLVASQDGSRFSVWEFGDNFAALGPSTSSSSSSCCQGAPKVGAGTPLAPLSLATASAPSHPVTHFATAPTTPTSTPHASRRAASVLTGPGCAYGGEDSSMTRPLLAAAAAPPPTAARRRTDLLPAFPSMRDSGTPSKGSSPRHRSPGVRSGTVTPGSPSRPTSALSQTSGGSQVVMRSRTAPKKPRPLSIAGSTLSSADKPRDGASPVAAAASLASPNRESRPIDRKSSGDSVTTKPLRAKSAGSDRSAPSTPAKTPRGTTARRTPAQVKAESAAKKAAERSKPPAKLRTTPKTTPLQSPSTESKALPDTVKMPVPKVSQRKEEHKEQQQPKEEQHMEEQQPKEDEHNEPKEDEHNEPKEEEHKEPQPEQDVDNLTSAVETRKESERELEEKVTLPSEEEVPTPVKTAPIPQEISLEKENEQIAVEEATEKSDTTTNVVGETTVKAEVSMADTVKEDTLPQDPSEHTDEAKEKEAQAMQAAQRAAEKPVTGYASESEYKLALAEKRRQAREAKERELELERQRKMEEEERERKEEEEYLRMLEEQKKAEEDRLKKAILEADKQREEEAIRKEEEERQRIETEKIEKQKKLEAEEKMRKEEEERQMRKSRVAAIMSRTRGKGSSTPSKAESKTPSDESKNLSESLMSSSMTENILNNISSSMTDSMIVQAIETQARKEESPFSEAETEPSPSTLVPSTDDCEMQQSPPVAFSTQSDVTHTETQVTTTESRVTVQQFTESSEQLISSSSTLAHETRVNGNAAPVPMDTTPTTQTADLLGSFSGVNGIGHNGVDSSSFQSADNQFSSLDPLRAPTQTVLASEERNDASPFDQIIDLNQTKLTNEDAVNSNPPPPAIIAFEDNLNKKQTQETSSNVPDLLL